MIGVPSEYEAVVVDSASQEPIAYLPWSTIEWQRVRNNVSAGSVKIAAADGGIECCAHFGGLRPWEMSLRIERDGHPVWDGPIVGWGRPSFPYDGSRDVVVRALDRGAILRRTFLASTFDYSLTPADYGTAVAAMLAATLVDIPFPLDAAVSLADLFTSDVYRYERLEPISATIDDIVNAIGQFWTVLTDTLHVFDEDTFWKPYRDMPVLTETTVLEIPGVEVDAVELVTVMYAAADSQGVAGFPNITFTDLRPLVAGSLSAQLDGAYTTMQSDAFFDLAGYTAQIQGAPRVAPSLTIEQVRVAPTFGTPRFDGTLDQLVPGIRCAVDFDDTCAFNVPVACYDIVLDEVLSADSCTHVRVDQIDVTVDVEDRAVGESVMLSCVPWVVDPRTWEPE